MTWHPCFFLSLFLWCDWKLWTPEIQMLCWSWYEAMPGSGNNRKEKETRWKGKKALHAEREWDKLVNPWQITWKLLDYKGPQCPVCFPISLSHAEKVYNFWYLGYSVWDCHRTLFPAHCHRIYIYIYFISIYIYIARDSYVFILEYDYHMFFFSAFFEKHLVMIGFVSGRKQSALIVH